MVALLSLRSKRFTAQLKDKNAVTGLSFTKAVQFDKNNKLYFFINKNKNVTSTH